MNKTKRRALSLLLVLSLFVGLVGIVNVDTTYAASKKIHLKKKTVSVVAGKTYQQKLINKNGKTIKASKVKWKSLKTSVAKINKKGKITAVKAGTAKMTAKYNGKTYKFTVKVKQPFAKGEKPTITKIEQNDYNGYYINPYWSKLKNAEYYELYVSKNGSSFELVEKSYSEIGLVQNATLGATYSFKVRGVCGKYKSSFSSVVTIKFKSNTSIMADPTSIYLEVGESKTVTVKTGEGESIKYQRSNTNVTCNWGDWVDDGNSVLLDITGEKEGQTVITIFDSVDNTVSATINVTIKAKPKDINVLLDYLKRNGDIEVSNTTSEGKRVTTISYSSDTNSILFNNGIIINSGNNLSISQQGFAIDEDFDNYTDKAYFYYRWDFYPNGDTSVTDYSYRMNSYVNARTYSPGDAIDWTITQESTAMSAEELGLKDGADSDFNKAIGYWNSALNQALGMNLSDIGMTNCN